jgi:hypothetical protein
MCEQIRTAGTDAARALRTAVFAAAALGAVLGVGVVLLAFVAGLLIGRTA